MERGNYNRRGGGGGGRGGYGRGRGGPGGRRGGGNSQQQYHQQGQYHQTGVGRGGAQAGSTNRPPPSQPWGNRPVHGGRGGSQMGTTNQPPVQGWVPRPQSTTTSTTVGGHGQGVGPTGGGGRGAWGSGRSWGGGGGRAPAPVPVNVHLSNQAASSGGSSWATVAGPGSSTSVAATDAGGQEAPDSVTSAMQSLHFSDSSPQPLATSSDEKLIPIKRPDRGGVVAVRSVNLLANHFPVSFNPESKILHYDVDVKRDVPSGSQAINQSIPKSVLSLIREKLFSDSIWEFALQKTAYDGEKNIFSAVELPTGIFKVELSHGEDTKARVYTVTIQKVKELPLFKLKDYLSCSLMSMPRDILQGMDLVMKENPSRCRISVGRCTYSREFREEDDLGGGVAAFKGFQQSLKPTSQGLALCLDCSVLAFHKRMPVIDFLRDQFRMRGVNDIVRMKGRVQSALKGLKVNVTHRVTKQKYTIAGLTDELVRDLSFTLEDPEGKDPPRKISLVQYFKERYGKNITYPYIPCLDVGKNKRQNYVPMEFCILVEGQRFPKEYLTQHAANKLKGISLAPPEKRMNTILEMVRAEDSPCGGDIIKNFEMGVVKNMTSVVGRVIMPPDLKLATPAGNMQVVKVGNQCQWNLSGISLAQGRTVDCWALIDFTSSDGNNRLNQDNFVSDLRERCQKLGIHMEEPLEIKSTDMRVLDDVNRIKKLLQDVVGTVSGKTKSRLQIAVCVMARRHNGYKSLKFVSETQVGVVTQCCLVKLAKEGKDQNLANLGLKINAKVGGSNVELVERFPCLEGRDPVMFVGIDVNHPAASNVTCPSIAAVVASVNWPAATQYAARVCPQIHRKEDIVNLGAMCSDLVDTFARLNNIKPKKIVVFRDGVSESQFDVVLNKELQDMKKAIYKENYRPTITLIVAQKRHQTRLFLQNQGGGGSRNISPGTVVDTKIVHPFEYDFYLCSHHGQLGTSKPTHYYVLYDDHNFRSDQLQKLIYQLCFTFARCSKPVSLVPPVYYADLVAFRGRMYQEMLSGPSASPSTSRVPSPPHDPSFNDNFYKLHSDLQDIMFFV